MNLVIIRHGDPDYEHDTLTEHGWTEAEVLAHRMEKMNVKDFYVSPLGRAQDTASCTLKQMNRTATTFNWLQEFPARVFLDEAATKESLLAAYPDRQIRDGRLTANVCWDVLPSYLFRHPEYFHPTQWRDSEITHSGNLLSVYDNVVTEFDRLLASYGYVRDGELYRVEQPNRDNIVFFCHFGLECVLLSHLMNVSPFILWHTTAFAPTSVSTIHTEEREQGTAIFRAAHLGDISHLTAAGMEPSFSARFCETYDTTDQRH